MNYGCNLQLNVYLYHIHHVAGKKRGEKTDQQRCVIYHGCLKNKTILFKKLLDNRVHMFSVALGSSKTYDYEQQTRLLKSS